jgi:hypothetical protein
VLGLFNGSLEVNNRKRFDEVGCQLFGHLDVDGECTTDSTKYWVFDYELVHRNGDFVNVTYL